MKSPEFAKFKDDLIRREKVDIQRNFRIIDALYEEAVALGIFPLEDPLEGIEVDIRIARVVNSVSGTARVDSS
jgi:hypothetical protein